MRFVVGKSPLKDFKALGSGPIEGIRSRWKRGRGTQLWVVADALPFADLPCFIAPNPRSLVLMPLCLVEQMLSV